MPSVPPLRRARHVSAGLALAAFAFLCACVALSGGLFFDRPVYEAIASLRSPGLTWFLVRFTNMGDVPVLLPLTLVLLGACCLKKRPGLGVLLAGNLALAALCNHLVKQVFQRARPDELLRLIEESGFSFPSGHSFTSMAFYGFLIYLIWKSFPDAAWKIPACAGLGLLILCIGLSRIYLGVHYASDVLAGFCGGVIWISVLTCIPAVRRIAIKSHPSEGGTNP